MGGPAFRGFDLGSDCFFVTGWLCDTMTLTPRRAFMAFEELISQYVNGAAELRKAIAGMMPAQIDAAPIPGQWSTRQIICHISDFEPVYADRIKRVIAEDRPTLMSGDPDQFAARLAYPQRDIAIELDLIEVVRKHLASILRTLPAESFQRVGVHSRDGDLSLETLLRRITNHVPHHAAFIAKKRQALEGRSL
jgi:hypothetical protein